MERLFEKLNLKFLKSNFNKNKDISSIKTKEFNLPLINAKDGDNGIMYYGRTQDFESTELAIGIVNDGAISTGNVYPQPQRTGVLYNAYLIRPKFNTNKELLYFFAAAIKKSIKHKYGYQNKASWAKVKEEKIKLPTKNKKIDFDFIESFIAKLEANHIAKLEANHIAELEAYLVASGLKDYTLTTREEQVLKDFKQGKIVFNEFEIERLFEIKSYKKRFDANKVAISEIGHPYVVRTSLNNGIRGFINEDEKYLNKGNTISFGQDTATVFYQEKPYFTGDKIKIVESKDSRFNKLSALFFVSAITKSFSSFAWGASNFNVKTIESQLVNIPTQNKQPDYEIMEILISAVQKLVIKNVVLYNDNKLAATKSIVSKRGI